MQIRSNNHILLHCHNKHRDANDSDFCGIIPIFKANFRIMISNFKIMANNNLKMVPDKIRGLLLPLDLLYLITGSKIKYRLVCAYWKKVNTLAGKKVDSLRTRL